MQSQRKLLNWLEENVNGTNYIFSSLDVYKVFEKISETNLDTILSRLTKNGYIERISQRKGLYSYKPNKFSKNLLLYNAANYLRRNEFNYLSLETILNEYGIISQIPQKYLSIMTSGRSGKFDLKNYGTIEFVYTSQKPNNIAKHLSYNFDKGMWKADAILAIRDMKKTHRNTNLINWDIANELIQ